MRIALKFSKLGIAAASIFLMLAAGVFAWLIYSSAVNPGDSGEGGVWLVLLALPWLGFLPQDLVGPGTAVICILVNALILYCVFGGIKVEKRR